MGELPKLDGYEHEIKTMQKNIEKGRKQYENKKNKQLKDEDIANKLKEEIERNGEEETEKFRKPINVLKTKQHKIDRDIKAITSKISSKQRFVDSSNRKIRDYKKQKQQLLNQLGGNESSKRLAFLNNQIDEAFKALNKYRKEKQILEPKQNANMENQANEAKLRELT